MGTNFDCVNLGLGHLQSAISALGLVFYSSKVWMQPKEDC